ncbi:MAG: DPP IV N-terminal domain-containing protein [Anaerolineae bacterium]|jgi:hypothetical protein
MRKNSRIVGLILLVTLILASCDGNGDGAAAKNPPSASKSAADLRVSDQREIEIKSARLISLSPDGRWLLADAKGVPCVYDTASLTPKFCAKESEIRTLDDQSVAWSPDGARVAFTENFFRYFFDSDLWVLEIESEKLTNLTDDAVERVTLGDEAQENPLVDVLPTWSPDGKKLLFARSAQRSSEWSGTILYRISSQGGKPERLQTIDRETPGAVWPSLRWTSDGKRILYTVYRNRRDDPHSGIWIAERDGKNSQQVLKVDKELGLPVLMDVSAQGDKALVFYAQAAGQLTNPPNACYYVLLDLETGDTEPIKQASGEQTEFFTPRTAAFSPDGSKVLYTYRSFDQESRLAVRDVAGGSENVLIASEEFLGYDAAIGLGLDWASDDTVYLATSPFTGLLISLETE